MGEKYGWLKKMNPFYAKKNHNLNNVFLLRLDLFYYQLAITILYASFMDSLFYKSTLRSCIMFAFSLAHEELVLVCIGISYYCLLSFTIYAIWNYDSKSLQCLIAIHSALFACYTIYGIYMITFLDRSPVDFATLVLTRDFYCESLLFTMRCLTILITILLLIAYLRSYGKNNLVIVYFKDKIQIASQDIEKNFNLKFSVAD